MASITTPKELKDEIQSLQIELAIKGKLLEEQVSNVFESLKPVNLLKSTMKDVSNSPLLLDSFLGLAVGLSSGFITKRVVVRKSLNPLRRILGSFLQLAITNIVARNPNTIKFIGNTIFNTIRRKKDNYAID